MARLGSGTPFKEVFCFLGGAESLGVKLFDAFIGASFPAR
jgi:hypothetical protein